MAKQSFIERYSQSDFSGGMGHNRFVRNGLKTALRMGPDKDSHLQITGQNIDQDIGDHDNDALTIEEEGMRVFLIRGSNLYLVTSKEVSAYQPSSDIFNPRHTFTIEVVDMWEWRGNIIFQMFSGNAQKLSGLSTITDLGFAPDRIGSANGFLYRYISGTGTVEVSTDGTTFNELIPSLAIDSCQKFMNYDANKSIIAIVNQKLAYEIDERNNFRVFDLPDEFPGGDQWYHANSGNRLFVNAFDGTYIFMLEKGDWKVIRPRFIEDRTIDIIYAISYAYDNFLLVSGATIDASTNRTSGSVLLYDFMEDTYSRIFENNADDIEVRDCIFFQNELLYFSQDLSGGTPANIVESHRIEQWKSGEFRTVPFNANFSELDKRLYEVSIFFDDLPADTVITVYLARENDEDNKITLGTATNEGDRFIKFDVYTNNLTFKEMYLLVNITKASIAETVTIRDIVTVYSYTKRYETLKKR